jgi:hypothetical protein
LFNDGVVVVFITILKLAQPGANLEMQHLIIIWTRSYRKLALGLELVMRVAIN